MNLTIVGVRTRAGLVGVDAADDGDAAAENADGKLLVDDAAATPETAAAAAESEEALMSKGVAIRVNCSVMPR